MMIGQVKELAEKYWSPCVKLRRHLHMHPELSFQEEHTASFVESELRSMSADSIERVDKCGVLATIHGKSKGDSLLLRADIDALPIFEKNDHDFVSKVPGVMHACGHDAHTAMLLTAGRILSDLKHSWDGTIKLLFQPAEEKIPGGASLMIKGGVLDSPKPKHVLGQHVMPRLKTGQVGIKSGTFMASSDEIFIEFQGKGGHAAMPERCIDPVAIAANFLVSIQQIVSRSANPKIPTVLSFGKIQGNGATNVIPEKVTLEGTFRTLNEEWRKVALEKIQEIAIAMAKSMGGTCKVDIAHGYPYLHNDTALSVEIKQRLSEYLSVENVIDQEVWMASEDFAYFSHQLPSCFYLLGVQGKNTTHPSDLHSPTFDLDEKAMEVGSGLLAYLAMRGLH